MKCIMAYKTQVSADTLEAMYDLMVESGQKASVFYDCRCSTKGDFFEMMNNTNMHYWALYYEGNLSGFAWINSIVGKSGFAHFCMFKNVYGRSSDGVSKSVELGRFVVSNWVRHTDRNGEYLLDVLVGITPKRNRMALKWVQRIGAVRRGDVPFGAWMADIGKSEDAVLFTITRDSTEDAWTNA